MSVLDRIQLTPPPSHVALRRDSVLWLLRRDEVHWIDGDRSGFVGPLMTFTPVTPQSGRAEEHLIALMRRHVIGYPDYFTAEIAGRYLLAAKWTDGVRNLITSVVDVGELVEIDFTLATPDSRSVDEAWGELTRMIHFDG